MRPPAGVSWRGEVVPADAAAVGGLVRHTGFFSEEEAAIAMELVEERLARGPASGYEFLLAEDGEGLAGYACFGRIPGTLSSFDLYWIAVRPADQGRGLGKEILARVEALSRAQGAARMYVDTSSRLLYQPTRAFYGRAGYQVAATFPEFYAPGDAKVVFCKDLGPA